MNNKANTLLPIIVALVLVVGVSSATGASPLPRPLQQGGAPTVVSYQGQVVVGDAAYNGTGHFKFGVVNDAGDTTYWSNDGTSVGGGEPTTAVQLDVSDGFFNVLLGDTSLANMSALTASAFAGTGRYLRVWFSTDGSTFEQLSPDRRIAAVPYALQAEEAKSADTVDGQHASAFWGINGNADTDSSVHFLGTTDNVSLTLRVNNAGALRLEPDATSPNVIGGNSANSVLDGVHGATIAGAGGNARPNRVTDHWSTVSGGRGNQAGDGSQGAGNASCATVGGGSDNTAFGYWATIAGGDNNWAGKVDFVGGGYANVVTGTASTIGGGWANVITNTAPVDNWLAAFWYNSIVGGERNSITGSNVLWSTIGGGDHNQIVDANRSFIGGGVQNVITRTAGAATIGGGEGNTASGDRSTIGGGEGNVASGGRSTVGGGYSNEASGNYASTIAGGYNNSASGNSATVPGGRDNTAAGNHSFAAGRRASANHAGAFVWGDSTNSDINSSGADQFIVRANGGIWFGQASGDLTPTIRSGVFISTSTGAHLTTGGDWTNASDRNAKENFAPVNGRDVLDRLAGVPITTWNYKAQDPSVRHMGPVAQDFYSAFRLGGGDTAISTVDADGVALAAVQELYQLVQEQDAQLAAQQEQIADLEARLAALERAPHENPASGQLWGTSLLGVTGVAGLAAVVAMGRRR